MTDAMEGAAAREPLAHVKVHEHGFVRLDDMLPSDRQGDLNIVRAARVSFNAEPASMGPKEIGLTNFLMRERHGTPYEHVVFQFRIRVTQSVMIEWLRHRMSSFNAESGRYSIYEEEYYVPDDDHVRTQKGKPGAYFFAPIQCNSGCTDGVIYIADEDKEIECVSCEGTGVDHKTVKAAQATMESVMENCFAAYKELLDMGVAKELARMVLPVSQYVSFMWTVNLRSLLNFLSLRNDKNAMREIREYAAVIEEMVTPFVIHTMRQFDDNGRRQP